MVSLVAGHAVKYWKVYNIWTDWRTDRHRTLFYQKSSAETLAQMS